MSTVLVTGSAGVIGRVTVAALQQSGFDVVPFDIADGQDLRDERQVSDAAAGCTAVVHAGAVPRDGLTTPAELMATNVLGTWHVLLAAERHAMQRVVHFSSVQVFGCSVGEGEPVYLPIDDRHPLRAARPYGLSKRLTEQMCEAWTSRTRIPTIALRPSWVLTDEMLPTIRPESADYGAFVHVDDVADAVVRALQVPDLVGHHRITLCGPGGFDSSAAYDLLGWRATRTWPEQSPRRSWLPWAGAGPRRR